jgi:hypothetical protein
MGKKYIIMNWYKKAKKDEDMVLLDNLYKNYYKKVDSSFIDKIAYNKRLGWLEIILSSGKKYTYIDVPMNIYRNFLRAKSKGEFFNRIIRNRYEIMSS